MSTDQDLWSAMLPNGDIRSGTLAQLDEACRSGHLDQGTLVRPIHSDRWITLAEVLGGARAASAPPTATGVAAPVVSGLDGVVQNLGTTGASGTVHVPGIG